MKSIYGKLVVPILVVLLLVIPAGLSAKERRGADLVVTRLDGSQVGGELIAVKRDSLLLLSYGRDESIDLADVKTVRIVKKSLAGKGTLYGFLAGALSGALWGIGHQDEDVFGKATPLAAGIYVGAIGALGGLALGIVVGFDTTFPVAGEPEALTRRRLENLRARTREFRTLGPEPAVERQPESEPRQPTPVPSASAAGPSRPWHKPRFRLSLPWNLGGFTANWADKPVEGGSFRFPGDVPPEEAGPYAISLTQDYSTSHRGRGLDSVDLAYEWTERWSVEMELIFSGWRAASSAEGILAFTSTIDGKTYETNIVNYLSANFSAALFGLTYRPFEPVIFRRHIVEAGLAVGPALARISDGYSPSRRVTLSAAAHAAYDFYIVPAVSVGAVVGYRYLRANFPASTTLMDRHFWDAADPYAGQLTRLTEVTISPQKIDASGPYISLRVGLRI
jgi:hypothetical protein